MGRPAVGRVCVQPVDNYSILTSNPLNISLRQLISFPRSWANFFVIFITRLGFDIL